MRVRSKITRSDAQGVAENWSSKNDDRFSKDLEWMFYNNINENNRNTQTLHGNTARNRTWIYDLSL